MPRPHGIRALVFDVPQLQGNHQLVTDVRTLDGPEDVFDILDAEALATLGGVYQATSPRPRWLKRSPIESAGNELVASACQTGSFMKESS